MFCFTMNLIIYYGLLQASSESSKMADTKPKILDNPDKIIAWKFPDVTESTQLRAIRLPDRSSKKNFGLELVLECHIPTMNITCIDFFAHVCVYIYIF